MSVYDDRVAETEQLIRFADTSGSEAAAIAATAHATLALAEQQRIANVIAIAQFDTGLNDKGQHLFTGLEAANIWRMDAVTALGLNDGRVK